MIESVNEFFDTDMFAQLVRYVPPAASSIALNFQVEGTTEIALRNAAADNVELAAKWTQAKETTIEKVALRLKRAGTIAAGKSVQVRIVKNTSGLPGSELVAISGLVAADTLSTSFALVDFTFLEKAVLEEGGIYHLVLVGNYDDSSSNHIKWRSKTVASGGNQEIKDAGWAAVATENFEVFAYIPVIFDSDAERSDIPPDVEYQNRSPQVLCRTADVSDARKTATVIIEGVTYKVIDIQRTATGTITLVLSKD